ncbi:MAG: SMP-30/gluconolactonase/LRE family protein [Dehalococcoidia bacterium]
MQLVANYKCSTGEGPLWHPDKQLLYWVDIPIGCLYSYDPETNSTQKIFQSGQIGGFTIQTDGSLLLFMEKGAVRLLRDGELTTIIDEIKGEENSRFNDVIANPDGSVFCGTMPSDKKPGSLYKLGLDKNISLVIENAGISNGLGFSNDLKHIYHTNSTDRTISKFEFDADNSRIGNREIIVTTPNDGSVPDGMTVDAEDCIWSARWDGWALYRYNTHGEEMDRIDFDVKKVSCPTFGGSNYEDIYVTSAGGEDPDNNGILAGGTFRLNYPTKGKAEYRSNIEI